MGMMGEFSGGVILGAALTAVGALLTAIITHRLNVRSARQAAIGLAIDVTRNIIKAGGQLDIVNNSTTLIATDYVAIIEGEVIVYGRNRENFVWLKNNMRDKLREFVIDVSLKRAKLSYFVTRVREKYNFADALQAAGDGPQAERVRKEALDLHNSEVQKAVQELVTCAKGGQAIVDALSSDGL
jgi:hypothetical protein